MTARLAPLALGLLLALTPDSAAMAQTPPPQPDGKAEGLSLMERGMQLFFRQLLDDMEPALEEMKQALSEMEPMVRELARMIGDVRNYEAPEKLPNGDILIRRRPGAPPPPPVPGAVPEAVPEGQIEL